MSDISPNSSATNQLRWLWLSWLILIIDQTSKWFAIRHLPLREPQYINSYFNLTLDFNTGAAFSFLRDAGGWQQYFFGSLALVMTIIIIIWLKRLLKIHNLTAVALALIIGGAWGNLLDRVMHGSVIDFISWHVNNHYWPTFNIADSAISIGAVLLIIGLSYDKNS